MDRENHYENFSTMLGQLQNLVSQHKYLVGGEDTKKVFDQLPEFERVIDETKPLYYGDLYLNNDKYPVYISPYASPNEVYVFDGYPQGSIKLDYKPLTPTVNWNLWEE